MREQVGERYRTLAAYGLVEHLWSDIDTSSNWEKGIWTANSWRFGKVPGEGSEPSISACPRFEARQSSSDTGRLPRPEHRISEPYECGAMSS